MVGDALSSVLRANRDLLNARFAHEASLSPHLDAARLQAFLRTGVDPLATAVAQAQPGALTATVLEAYDLGLELLGKGVLDMPGFPEDGLAEVAVAAAPIVAAAPRRVLGAASNALVELARTPGARPRTWTTLMATLARQCKDVRTFLHVGIVAGWLSGLAHYRTGALAVADELPDALALAVLGAPAGGNWPALRARLAEDPWFAPDGRAVPIVRLVGGFRGFGGLFTAPPVVGLRAGQFVARSGGDAWLLSSDAFGTTFHRATEPERAAAEAGSEAAAPAVVDRHITVGGRRVRLPIAGSLTSFAADATTAMVTAELGHGVAVIALTGAG